MTTRRSQRVAQQRKKRLELFFQESPLGAIQWDEDVRVERMTALIDDLPTLAREGNQVDEIETVTITDAARDS